MHKAIVFNIRGPSWRLAGVGMRLFRGLDGSGDADDHPAQRHLNEDRARRGRSSPGMRPWTRWGFRTAHSNLSRISTTQSITRFASSTVVTRPACQRRWPLNLEPYRYTTPDPEIDWHKLRGSTPASYVTVVLRGLDDNGTSPVLLEIQLRTRVGGIAERSLGHVCGRLISLRNCREPTSTLNTAATAFIKMEVDAMRDRAPRALRIRDD
jgi:hypothetical protein